MKSRRTKALEIPPAVKSKVYERDGGCCVWCGSPNGQPNAHWRSRAKSGKGIEENILTLCWPCHLQYDQSGKKAEMRLYFKRYLQSKYPDWSEDKIIYNKYE